MGKKGKLKPEAGFASKSVGRSKLAKKNALPRTKMPGSFNLTANTLEIMRTHWRVLGGIAGIYLLVTALLASGLGNFISALNGVQDNIDLSDEGKGSISTAFNSFAGLLGGNSQSGSAMQSILIVIVSLVIIWALRQLLAGKSVSTKQAYYHSMSPFIPFVIIIFVIILQLLPITIGTAALGVILSSVFENGALITIASSLAFALLAAWSLYMLSSSVLALYIVTLPDMKPRDALRSAKNLARSRRWQLMRRLAYLPLFILAVMLVAVIPLILLLPIAAVAVFYVLGTLAIFFSHIYLYSLYRSLI